MPQKKQEQLDEKISFEDFKAEILSDYELAVASREASLIGRKEVLTGKAKFGIFGDGKELAQIAVAKTMQPGDIRSGYYRDQTLMFATGMSNIEQFFTQLYAIADVKEEPASAGRMMNGHYGTRWLDKNQEYKNLLESPQSTSDISPTAGQMVRSLGIAYASKVYRNSDAVKTGFEKFTNNGNEVSFVTIGDASTSEGQFWETVNAAGVLQVPLAIFVWDDGYGISVPQKYQTTKSSISAITAGFQYDEKLASGLEIYKVKGWDYASMVETFQKGIDRVRTHHIPAIFHVQEVTQPQGHSTSGSHERYKSEERLAWEKEFDCIVKLKQFITENAIATEAELADIEIKAKESAKEAKKTAWEKFLNPLKKDVEQAVQLGNQVVFTGGPNAQFIATALKELSSLKEPIRKDILHTTFKVLQYADKTSQAYKNLNNFYQNYLQIGREKYSSNLYSNSAKAVKNIPVVAADFSNSETLSGHEIINKYFDYQLNANPAFLAMGEDVGKIGDVNQGFAGLQEKYGTWRVCDTGIRELTIIGQGIGLAMRGLRPVVEIQYLDYLLYGLQPLSDDVATMLYRTNGGQKCPLIVRTRGHRLEGIWHSGSPMGVTLSALRGMNICVPRNMTQAAGMYSTLFQSDEPAIVVECLNGYRLKEQMPANLNTFTVPLGVPEVLQEGEDITIVSYGSTLRVIQDAIKQYLEPNGISVELVDVQTLYPFDVNGKILDSLKKTNRILFVDEDVPGGATSFMFQQVIEKQGGYRWLDATPQTLAAQAHRPAYSTDGDYFSKPNAEDIAIKVQEIIAE